MNSIIESLNWRYAVKKYDNTKRISDDDLETIKASLRLTATSFGLQPLKFLIVENPEIREKLKTQKDMFKSSFEGDKQFSEVDVESKAIQAIDKWWPYLSECDVSFPEGKNLHALMLGNF